MTDFPVTPPVAEDVLALLRSELPESPTVSAPLAVEEPLSLLQRLVSSDKSAAVAALLHIAILLITALGMRLSGADVATIGAVVSVAVTYFAEVNFRARASSSTPTKP